MGESRSEEDIRRRAAGGPASAPGESVADASQRSLPSFQNEDLTVSIHASGHGGRREAKVLEAGTLVGRYLILDRIAAGGMGAVYRGYDPKLDRKVAVKVVAVVHEDENAGESAAERLMREARALAQLSHPNVVAVYDVGSYKGDVFIAMALVEGRTLRAWNREGNHTAREIVDVFASAGRGLAEAHRAGIVHRDFKPDNVLIGDDGRVRVVDFGIAVAEDEGKGGSLSSGVSESSGDSPNASSDSISTSHSNVSRLTRVGALVGTPSYMSPEQFLGEPVDGKSDQFSFCVALYESLFGKRPFAGKTISDIKRNVISGEMREPPTESRVSAHLRRTVERGLSPSPNDRYPSMEDLLAELGKDPGARRRRWLALVAASLLTALMASAVRGAVSEGDGLAARCRAAGDTVETVWSPGARASIAEAFASARAPYAADTARRLVALLDERAASWRQTRRDVCEATWVRGEQSESLLDRRMECLDRRLNEMSSLVQLFSGKVDRGLVDRAVQAAVSLSSVEDCAQVSASQGSSAAPIEPQNRARLDALNKRIDALEVMYVAGRYRQGVEEGEPLMAEAESLGYAPAQAEASLILGELLSRAGEYERAAAVYERGLRFAARAGDHRLGSLIASKRLSVVGHSLDRHEEALLLLPGAEVAAIRAGETPEVREELFAALGMVHHARREYDLARRHFEKSLEILREQRNESDLHLAWPLSNLGGVLIQLNRYDEAVVHLERARAIFEAALGADHPSVATALNNLAMAYHGANRDEEALVAIRRALSLSERAQGPDDPDVAAKLDSLGEILASSGDFSTAQGHYRRALKILESKLGPRHQNTGLVLNSLGYVLYEQGKYEEARAHYERAVAALEASVGGDHPVTGVALIGLGCARVELGDKAAAVAALERGLSLVQDVDSLPTAYARFALAKALWRERAKRQLALSLARRAHAFLATDGHQFAKERRERVETWLKIATTNGRR